MKKRKFGDIYSVDLGSTGRGYFQHVADDRTQLSSNVVRVFERAADDHFSIDAIAKLPTAFHAHVAIPVGIKLRIWKVVAHLDLPSPIDDLRFRICNEYGRQAPKHSRDWSVWCIGKPLKRVGPLDEITRTYEIGVIVNPLSVRFRMISGRYDFFYPEG
jgi:hypothetical protein